MSSHPYAIIVNGTGAVLEYKLGTHAPGTELTESTCNVTSHTTDGNVRTIIIDRNFTGPTSDYFAFTSDTIKNSLNMISGVGSGGSFPAIHSSYAIGTLK